MLPEGGPPREHVYYIGPEQVFDAPWAVPLPTSEGAPAEPEILLEAEGRLRWVPVSSAAGYLATTVGLAEADQAPQLAYEMNHGAIIAVP